MLITSESKENYQQDQQHDLSTKYRLATKKLLTKIFNNPFSPQQENDLNTYGYYLLAEQRNQDAIAVFKQITQAKPDSLNAFDSLAEAYETTKNHAQAIKTLEKVIAIADSKEDVNTASYVQKLNRLKKMINAD